MKKTVLVGGCFDILHLGHIIFLEKAKQKGDTLVVLLESDEAVRFLKGAGRPINPQKTRAKILSSLKSVDKVVLLKNKMTDKDYDFLIQKIKPAIIATTKNDPYIHHKMRQAKLVGAKVAEVTKNIANYSSSKLAKEIL